RMPRRPLRVRGSRLQQLLRLPLNLRRARRRMPRRLASAHQLRNERVPRAMSVEKVAGGHSVGLPAKGLRGWFDWMDQPRLHRSTLTWWWRALLVHLLVREVLRYFQHGHSGRMALAAAFAACLVLALRDKVPRLSEQASCLVGECKFVALFPDNSNHSYIELLLLLAFVLASQQKIPAYTELISFNRVLGALVFFGSGLQKALHGTYFH